MLLSLSVKISSSLFQPRSVEFSPSLPFLLFYVPLSFIRTFLVPSCSRSQHPPDTSLHCYLPSVLVSFSLICLYSQPSDSLSFSLWLMLTFYLSISFYFPSVMCVFYPLLLSFSLFVYLFLFSVARCSLSIGVDIERYIYKYNYLYLLHDSFSRFKNLD